MLRAYSFIIPVFNRPQEIKELLESFVHLNYSGDFEIVIVEDGSTIKCEEIVSHFQDRLNVSYYYKSNSGPGDSRNFGMEQATGNYYIILDSDCLLPQQYLDEVNKALDKHYMDCFGGPDTAHSSFSSLQKAINYVMTSYLTTGGIRGKKKAVQRFEPRSFNMGLSKKAFLATGGFGKIHPGEDPDLAHRLLKQNFVIGFVENAFVYHKRRISWSKFYIQVKKFGLVRPILTKWHPHSAKLTFWFPFLFVIYTVISLVFLIFGYWLSIAFLLCYILAVFFDASFKYRSLRIGLYSILALFIQFFGYGLAFARSTFFIRILNENPQKRFPQLFFD